MALKKEFKVKNGLIVSGDIDFTGVITGDGSGLTGKQDTLVSGVNIKTINGTSILGSGDIVISGGGSETDPVYAASSWYSTTNNSSNWDTAYGWGNHASAGYLTSYTETDPVYVASSWYSTTNNSSNWDTAYGWGNHASAGYLTSYTETDPVYTGSSWYSTTNNSSNWDTAYGWGNHASAGYLTSYTETDPVYTASSWYSTTNNSSNWDTAYGWGNHASAGYLTSSSLSGYATESYVTTAISGKANSSDVTYVGTTQVALNRASAPQALTGITSVRFGNSILADGTLTVASTSSNNILDTFSATDFRTAKYVIQAVTSSEVLSTEVLIMHDGATVYLTEYATLYISSNPIVITADIVSGQVRLLIQTLSNDTTLSFVRTSLNAGSFGGGGGIQGDLMLQSGSEDLQTSSGSEDLNV